MKEIDYLLNKRWEHVHLAKRAMEVWEYIESPGPGAAVGTR